VNTRRLTLRGLFGLCAVAGVALLCGSPALAARGHVFSGTFGSEGSGDGQFKEPSGVAVNEATGDVYVVDKGNNRVEWLNAAGASFKGQFNGSGLLLNEGLAAGHGGLPNEIETGQFSEPEGIAIDNSCSLHKPVLTEASIPTCKEFDPSSGDVYVVDAGHRVIDKFSSTGAYVGQLTGTCPSIEKCPPASVLPFGGLFGVSVDATGEVWVYHDEKEAANFTNSVANEYIHNRGPLNGFGFAEPGFAVDSEDNFYAHINGLFAGTDLIYKYDREGNVLIGEESPIDSQPPTGVTVELSHDDVYIGNSTTVSVFSPSGALLESLGSGHLENGSGIGVSSAAEEVYVADSTADVIDVFSPEPPSAPTVESESLAEVAATSATLSAEINPRGAASAYQFEYGLCPTSGTCATSSFEVGMPIPQGSIAPDFSIHSESVHPQDLVAHSTYHFRVVAQNENGLVDGVEQIFTTQAVGGGSVSSGNRAWELVSPPDKYGALIETIGEKGVIETANDGNAITYLTNAPTEAYPEGDSNEVQVLSTRGSAGWTSQDIAVAHEAATGAAVGPGEEYPYFSNDLSLGVVQLLGGFVKQLSGEASEQTPYLRKNYAGPDGHRCSSECYRPLVTGKVGYANVPAGTEFGEEGLCAHSLSGPLLLECGPTFRSATSDLSHIVLSSRIPLTPEAGSQALYEWAGGRLTLVSILPDGTSASNPEIGPGSGNHVARHSISADGSRIVWQSNSVLYMRDIVREETVQLDAAESECESSECGKGNGVFQIASADGSKVLFTDAQRLTREAGASQGHADLYECEMVETAGKLKCRLSDLTPRSAGGEEAGVQGGVVGASDDGSWVYFVADGVLAPGAEPGTCEGRKRDATCNLYVRHGGETRLVAVLSGEDRPDWAEALLPGLVGLTARVSPNGEWLAFMSQRSLTGYDNRDAVSGHLDEEVYVYHASAGAALVCASCNPTGARPHGAEYGPLRAGRGGLVGGSETWESTQWLAANVPGWTPYESSTALYQSRYLSDSGRLFFNSSDALVPQDVNGTQDVYQYESPGEGECTAASVTFSERSGGCVDLVSSGTSATESAFLDASESGGDVFFLTAARLASQDADASVDVYDAQECIGTSPCFPSSAAQSPPCTTETSCRPAPTPQPSAFGVPASATFAGAGNHPPSATSKSSLKPKSLTRAQRLARALKACRAKHKGSRSACEARIRKRYRDAKRKKSANVNRRGQS
jgi:DNA-binding beta-propeller fold protein YncE